jgi:hypothetical protein
LTERVQKAGFSADPSAPAEGWFGLGEVDCPDGLARCNGGVVQVSVAARRPAHCSGNAEVCACPWAVVASCSGVCVADGVEAFLPSDRASAQLCAPAPDAAVFARPAMAAGTLPPLGEACEGEGVACLGSTVARCEPTPRLLGSCVRGCSTSGLVGANGLADDQVMAILCSH